MELSAQVIVRVNIISAHRLGRTNSEIHDFFKYPKSTIRQNIALFSDWVSDGNDPDMFPYIRRKKITKKNPKKLLKSLKKCKVTLVRQCAKLPAI